MLLTLLVEIIFRRVGPIQTCPRGLRSVLLSPVHELGRYQPPFDRSKWKESTEYHHGEGGEQVYPPWRIEGDLYPHNEKSQREGDNAKRKERGAIIRRRKPVIETTRLAIIRNFKPRLKHMALSAARA